MPGDRWWVKGGGGPLHRSGPGVRWWISARSGANVRWWIRGGCGPQHLPGLGVRLWIKGGVDHSICQVWVSGCGSREVWTTAYARSGCQVVDLCLVRVLGGGFLLGVGARWWFTGGRPHAAYVEGVAAQG
jgi:hypothetical protein